MQLTLNGIQKKEDWKAANIALPTYDIEKIRKKHKRKSCMGTLWCRQYLPHFHGQSG